MIINPQNFFIMRGVERHYVRHKIDGGLRFISEEYCYGDVVAVLMEDNTVRYLPNAISEIAYYAKRGIHFDSWGPDVTVGFRYIPEKQLALVQANPEIDPNQWNLVRNWDDRWYSALPCNIASIVKNTSDNIHGS